MYQRFGKRKDIFSLHGLMMALVKSNVNNELVFYILLQYLRDWYDVPTFGLSFFIRRSLPLSRLFFANRVIQTFVEHANKAFSFVNFWNFETCNRIEFKIVVEKDVIPMGGRVLKGSLKEALKGAKGAHQQKIVPKFESHNL